MEKDTIIADLRKQIVNKDKNLQVQRSQFDETIRNLQVRNGKFSLPSK